MPIYSDLDIEKLISCPKSVSDAPAKHLKLIGADWRNHCKMIATDGTKGTFSMFMRKSEDFPENFSVGLLYKAEDGSEITLLRCNGKHGVFNGGDDPNHPHFEFHTHKASARAINAGFAPEKYAEKSTEFASYEQALQYFVRVIGLDPQDVAKHFPSEIQSSFEFTK